MLVDEKLKIADRELQFRYLLKSPVRYACKRVFELFPKSAGVPVHSSILVDILDRPSGGVVFPNGKLLVDGKLWTLSKKGQYLFLRMVSPDNYAVGMEAIISPERNKVKVFLDTPWAGQNGFVSAWNLLFQIIFRASLDAECEQFVKGMGIVVKNKGFLVNTCANSKTAQIVDALKKRFLLLGQNRLLLRKQEDEFYLYATPWTRNAALASCCANFRLDNMVLIGTKSSEGVVMLDSKKVIEHFAPIGADSAYHDFSDEKHSLLENVEAFGLPRGPEELVTAALIRMAEMGSLSPTSS